MKQQFIDYLTSFALASLGRWAKDFYYFQKSKRPLSMPRKRLLAAALYSGVTGSVICMLLIWYKPELGGSGLIWAVSLLAGIGAVDLADVAYLGFQQWARRAVGLKPPPDEE